MTAPKFVPYKGGAGPSKAQADGNASALAAAVGGTTVEQKITGDTDELGLVAIRGDRYVVYDRWGFMAVDAEGWPVDDPDVLPDQASWEEWVVVDTERRAYIFNNETDAREHAVWLEAVDDQLRPCRCYPEFNSVHCVRFVGGAA